MVSKDIRNYLAMRMGPFEIVKQACERRGPLWGRTETKTLKRPFMGK